LDEHTLDYSSDGKRLAFASTRSGSEEIWVSDVDGSDPIQLTSMGGPQCANPRWSPDGRLILFNSRREGSADLYLLRPDTGELRRITDDPAPRKSNQDGRGMDALFTSARIAPGDWKSRRCPQVEVPLSALPNREGSRRLNRLTAASSITPSTRVSRLRSGACRLPAG
jgi:dipeptidyl aminopeptidase/acylaminoacyl peptidase